MLARYHRYRRAGDRLAAGRLQAELYALPGFRSEEVLPMVLVWFARPAGTAASFTPRRPGWYGEATMRDMRSSVRRYRGPPDAHESRRARQGAIACVVVSST